MQHTNHTTSLPFQKQIWPLCSGIFRPNWGPKSWKEFFADQPLKRTRVALKRAVVCLNQHSHCFLWFTQSYEFSFLLYLHLFWPKPFSLQFIFKYEGFDKPFFTTFFKTSSFMIYLTGFLFYEPWRLQCIACLKNETSSNVSDKKEHYDLYADP